MRVYFYLLIVLSLSFYFNNTTKKEIFINHGFDQKILEEDEFSRPDTSINKRISLFDNVGVEKYLKLIEKTPRYNDYIFVLNQSGTQCLSLEIALGGLRNEFMYFEIFNRYDKTINNKLEYSKIDFDKVKYYQSDFKEFSTESSIKLDISKQELIKIKGKGYRISRNNDGEILTYNIDADENPKSAFLTKYNMPLYIAKYHFRKGKLIRFSFGFSD